jgi:hypothetical protein
MGWCSSVVVGGLALEAGRTVSYVDMTPPYPGNASRCYERLATSGCRKIEFSELIENKNFFYEVSAASIPQVNVPPFAVNKRGFVKMERDEIEAPRVIQYLQCGDHNIAFKRTICLVEKRCP